MKLLFIQGGTRLKRDIEGNWYTDGNLTQEIFDRYTKYCDELIVILRKENHIYKVEDAKHRFNPIIDKKIRIVAVDDITRPKLNFFNLFMRYKINKSIYNEISKADKIIIRSASYMTKQAYLACQKYKKPYIVEVTGFIFESMYYHGFLGRIFATHYEKLLKAMTLKAEGAIYVTQEALQNRYPCPNIMLGCSDVQLSTLDKKYLLNRIEKIKNKKDKTIILGTAAFLDVAWKGQENVIRAIAELKKRGITNIVYELIGLGTGKHLIETAKKLGVSNQIKILGAKNHDEVFTWLDHIDIYIQPSYQEGLCRAIVEAMSRACPIVCSNAGGNYELIDHNYIFDCGNYMQCAEKIESIMQNQIEQAKRNFSRAKDYELEILNKRRSSFISQFVNQ